MRALTALIVVAGVALTAATTDPSGMVNVAAQAGPQPATLSAIVERDRVQPGTSVRVALQVTLPEGYHANSHRPRDPNLVAMRITVPPAPGVTATEIVFPEDKDFVVAGYSEALRVFEGQFLIGVQLDLGKDISPGALKVPATFRYQACNDVTCFFPKSMPVEWTLNVAAKASPVDAKNAAAFRTIRFGKGDKPEAVAQPATPPTGGPAPSTTAAATATLDDFEVIGTTGGYLRAADFITFVKNAEAGIVEQGMFEGRGPLAILLLVLVGGLALNLTPCVLPMIPINLAIIGAGTRSGSRGRGLVLGAAYGAAMAVVYGVLGLIVILTAGTFGTINSSPWFNVGIAVLFVVLALAMFDVITIDFSRFSSNLQVGTPGQGSVLVAFGMGAVAALLAGACVAPVVIQVVLFSSNLYAAGTSAALALPFVLGLGMAIPWPIAGAGIGALPKPGAWMVRVKQLFGLIILATAVYYAYVAYGIFRDRSADPAAVRAAVEEQLKAGWQSSLEQGLTAAKRDRKPVLIDFWATWCKNCETMDLTTFKDPSVLSALDGYVKIKYQAESIDESPAREVLKRFNAVGLPTYVLLRPR